MGSNEVNLTLGTDRGKLRLRWQLGGKRYSLALGLKDTKTNRLKAAPMKLLIESDIERGIFDRSLTKYRHHLKPDKKTSVQTFEDLFELWISSKNVSARTIEWYKSIRYEPIKNIPISQLNSYHISFKLLPYYGTKKSVKRWIEVFGACWTWGVNQGFCNQENDPFSICITPIKSEESDPFSQEEIELIIEGFKEKYPDLLYLVRFLFLTGCRTGEALGLKWIDFDEDLTTVTIRRQLTRKGEKPPKNGKIRIFRLNQNLSHILQRLDKNTQYVFHDGELNDNKLLKKWGRVLKLKNVRYRKHYNTRHTFTSHCLASGMNPTEVSRITGHDLAVMCRHYAGLINSPTIPDFDF